MTDAAGGLPEPAGPWSHERRGIVVNALGVGIAVAAYGVSFGAISVTGGLSVLQTQVLSALMFTGGSQFALIGVLAAIAIPNYQKFQARARQSEARVALAAVYTAERGYSVESSTFSGCLRQIGYLPDGAQQYYGVGFANTVAVATNAACGPNGGASCLAYTWSGVAAGNSCTQATDTFFPPNVKVNSGATLADQAAGGATLTKDTFSARAAGNISNSATGNDVWSIDQGKTLTNVTPTL